MGKKKGRSLEAGTRKEEGVLRLGQEKRKKSGGWARKEEEVWRLGKKKGRSLEAGTRKEEGVLRLGQEKRKESGCREQEKGRNRKEAGRSLEVET